MSEPSIEERIKAALPHASGLRPPRESVADRLRALAGEAERRSVEWDLYGENGVLDDLESRLAGLLGTEAAAWFPSGIMAQQCALRVWTDRMGTRRVALPDLSHLVVHEDDGPRVVHGFEYVWLTQGPRTATAADVEALPGEIGVVLVELPLRDGGYLLPAWGELVALSEACRDRGVPLHLDGARLWESVDHLGHGLAEVAALADSVYVSFYKGLDGLAGAALLGPRDVVDEARLWRRRLGGTVYSVAPHALSALAVLDRHAQMPAACARARDLAGRLHDAGVRTVPTTPQTNAFRVFLEGEPETLRARAVEVLEAGVAVPLRWARADVPGWCFAEVTVMPGGDADLDGYARALAALGSADDPTSPHDGRG